MSEPAIQPIRLTMRSRQTRRRKETAFRVFCLIAATSSILVLGVLLTTIFLQGYMHLDWDFITSSPSRRPGDAGIFPAMIGSIAIMLVCAFTAIPIGVSAAIFLEEYKPRNRWAKRAHGFVQLNIANLAGVPSVVYGILGLTVFVSAFNTFGSSNTPEFELGADYYDYVIDEGGHRISFPLEFREAPETQLAQGMTGRSEDGQWVTLTFVTTEEATKKGDAMDQLQGVIVASDLPVVQRTSEYAWYYVRLPLGRSVLAGGLTLMLVVLPVIIISSQEALRAVPDSLRRGALALGATRWQMVWNITLPASIGGIMTGTILAMSRAIGEAAPILVIAGVVYITFTPAHVMDDFTAMPLQIFDWASRPSEEFHQVAAAGILVLLAVLLTFNAVAVFIRYRFQRFL